MDKDYLKMVLALPDEFIKNLSVKKEEDERRRIEEELKLLRELQKKYPGE